jgi:hypothetical protein
MRLIGSLPVILCWRIGAVLLGRNTEGRDGDQSMTFSRFACARACAVILLIAVYAACAADSTVAPGVPVKARKLTHTVQLRPGMKMTPRQYEQYHRQFERLKSVKSRVRQLHAGSSGTNLLLAGRSTTTNRKSDRLRLRT